VTPDGCLGHVSPAVSGTGPATMAGELVHRVAGGAVAVGEPGSGEQFLVAEWLTVPRGCPEDRGGPDGCMWTCGFELSQPLVFLPC
jgi:hypothetical protein